MAFAPVDQPRIALAVIVENAGWGAAAAAPIARRVFDYLLLDQYPSPEGHRPDPEAGQSVAPVGTPRSVADQCRCRGGGPGRGPVPLAVADGAGPVGCGWPWHRPAGRLRLMPRAVNPAPAPALERTR